MLYYTEKKKKKTLGYSYVTHVPFNVVTCLASQLVGPLINQVVDI